MRDGRADVAVHSLKDMPMEMARGLHDRRRSRCARTRAMRSSAITYASIEALPDGAIVGTSSLRREAQLRESNPRLHRAPASRQREHARAQARRGPVRRDDPRRRGPEPPRAEPSHLGVPRARRFPSRGRAGRARASNARWIVPTSSPRSRRSCIIRPISPSRRSGRSRARSSGSCHTPIAGYAMFRDGELWLRGLLAKREGTDVLRGERSVALDADAGDVAVADALGAGPRRRFQVARRCATHRSGRVGASSAI